MTKEEDPVGVDTDNAPVEEEDPVGVVTDNAPVEERGETGGGNPDASLLEEKRTRARYVPSTRRHGTLLFFSPEDRKSMRDLEQAVVTLATTEHTVQVQDATQSGDDLEKSVIESALTAGWDKSDKNLARDFSSDNDSSAADDNDHDQTAPSPTALLRHSGHNRRATRHGAFRVEGESSELLMSGSLRRASEGDISISSDDVNGDTVTVPVLAADVPIVSVEARAVDEDYDAQLRATIEEEIRAQLQEEAVKGSVVGRLSSSFGVQQLQLQQWNDRRQSKKLCLILLVVLILAGVIVGVTSLVLSSTKESGQKDEITAQIEHGDGSMDALLRLSTLEIVQQRGYVRCGSSELAAFSATRVIPEDQAAKSSTLPFAGPHMEGFNVEQCRAMALLALGNPNLYEMVPIDFGHIFDGLNKGLIDLMTETITHTMNRDVQHDGTKASFSFSPPYLYDGGSFIGDPAFVDCAEGSNDFYGFCRRLKICSLKGGTIHSVLKKTVGGTTLVDSQSLEDMVVRYSNGECNVLASDRSLLAAAARENPDVSSGWKFAKTTISKEPLTIVTREGDAEWSAMVSLVIDTWVLAEAYNISQANPQLIADLLEKGDPTSSGIKGSGETLPGLEAQMVSLVETFGNYGELYDKHIAKHIERGKGLNTPYTRNSSNGLLYNMPFGNLDTESPGPVSNGTIASILENGALMCGILPMRGPEFVSMINGTWEGFDVEFCRGLSATLFEGDKEKVEFVELETMEHAFDAISTNTVDVVAGSRITLQAKYLEPSTQQRYSFSPPYYYDNANHDAYALMTRSDDPQWSDYVYWMVTATIYAEEQGINASSALEMPLVLLFGESFKQCFRDMVSAIGSYAEVYASNLEDTIPRVGANRLNDGESPQMFPIRPN